MAFMFLHIFSLLLMSHSSKAVTHKLLFSKTVVNTHVLSNNKEQWGITLNSKTCQSLFLFCDLDDWATVLYPMKSWVEFSPETPFLFYLKFTI